MEDIGLLAEILGVFAAVLTLGGILFNFLRDQKRLRIIIQENSFGGNPKITLINESNKPISIVDIAGALDNGDPIPRNSFLLETNLESTLFPLTIRAGESVQFTLSDLFTDPDVKFSVTVSGIDGKQYRKNFHLIYDSKFGRIQKK